MVGLLLFMLGLGLGFVLGVSFVLVRCKTSPQYWAWLQKQVFTGRWGK